jgi:uncharacterized membrane protein YecN with MAPEG domain
MKLLSFRVNDKNKYGLATADGVIDLQARFPQYGSLLEFIPHLHLLILCRRLRNRRTILSTRSLSCRSLLNRKNYLRWRELSR